MFEFLVGRLFISFYFTVINLFTLNFIERRTLFLYSITFNLNLIIILFFISFHFFFQDQGLLEGGVVQAAKRLLPRTDDQVKLLLLSLLIASQQPATVLVCHGKLLWF